MQQMNAIAPGGIASMMRGMPQGQPQKPLSPTAGIGNVADRMKAYGPQMLEQKNAVSEDLLNLIAAQKLKSEKEAALRDMQMKAAQQGQPLTVAQSLDKELMQMTKQEMAPQQAAPQVAGASQQQEQQKQAMMQKLMGGIARAPGAQQMPGMAAGGIVAFQNRGEVPQDATLKAYNEAKRQLVAATQSGDPQSVQFYLKRLQELRNQIEPGLLQQAERETSKAEAPVRVASMLEGPAPQEQQAIGGKAIDQAELDRVKAMTEQGPQFDIRQPVSPQLLADLQQKAGQVGPSERAGLEQQIEKMRGQLPQARPSAAVPGQAPTPGITQTLDKPPMTADAAGQGISPAMGPQIPGPEAARRMRQDEAAKVYGPSEEETKLYEEQMARLRQEAQPKDQRWYERLGALAPYLAQQRIDPSRGGIAGGLGRIAVAGQQMGAAEQSEREKRQARIDALQKQRMDQLRLGRVAGFEAGIGAEKAAQEADLAREGLAERRFATTEASRIGEAQIAAADRRAKEQSGATTDLQRRINLFKNDPDTYKSIFGKEEKNVAFEALKIKADLLGKQLTGTTPLMGDAKKRVEQELAMVESALSKLAGLGAAAAPSQKPPPKVGTVMDGYKFKGGDPSNKNNWEKV